jgi:class 3 adenylate cyclase/ABC-type uncharacterized transport system substrate-binding protein
MNSERAERRLAAILAADIAGYSRLMGADEEGTLAALKAIRRELADLKIAEHRGRIVKATGDGLLAEFPSVVDAVRCAVEVQRGMADRNAGVSPAERHIEFRIGINLGDIIIDEGDIFGDGVNVAARLEALAEPGGICISRVVRDQVRDRLDLAFEDLGEQALKNISRAVRVYRVRAASEATVSEPAPLPSRPLNTEPGTAAPSSAQKMRCIGYLGVGPRPIDNEFRRALTTYGHVEGKTIEIHYRWSGGVLARNADLAQELVALGVELIVAAATPAVAAAKQVTSTIPIVMVEVGDPVAYGIVPSLLRPRGNVTGMSNGLHEFGPRSLRLFKEIVPEAIQVAVLVPVNAPGIATKSFEDAAHTLGMIPRTYVAGTADELYAVLAGLDRRTCDVLFVIPDHGLAVNRSIIISTATSLKIPVLCPWPAYVPDGGFMSLSPDRIEVHRRVAYYVDAILKGTPPRELPIEEPSKASLLINLRTARLLGITIPAPILMRADELIE